MKPGALFARIDRVAGWGHAIARDPESGQPLGLTNQAIYYILDERRQQAGWSRSHCTTCGAPSQGICSTPPPTW